MSITPNTYYHRIENEIGRWHPEDKEKVRAIMRDLSPIIDEMLSLDIRVIESWDR